MTRVHLRPDLARTNLRSATNHGPHEPSLRNLHRGSPEGRRSGPSSACLLAACFVVAALLVFCRPMAAGPADCRPLGAAARFNAIIAAGKSAACRAVRSIYRSSGRGGGSTSASSSHRQQQLLAQASRAARRRAGSYPQRLPIKRSCCKRSRAISRIWSEPSNSSRRTSSKWPATIQKPLAELKASQEEMKRALAKVSEPNPPKTAQPASPPPTQPAPALRKPERTYQPPQARARPRYYPKGVDLRRRLVAVDSVIIFVRL